MDSNTQHDTMSHPAGQDGFFAHHGMWAPGVRLFRRLCFRNKALLITAIFLIPLATLSTVYLRQVDAVLSLNEREQAGLVYLGKLLPLLPLLQEQRFLAAQGSQGEAQAVALAARVQQQMQAVVAHDKLQGAAMKTTELSAALAAAVEKATPKPGTNPLSGIRRQSLAIDAALRLTGGVVDGSGLAVDPDLNIKVLIDSGLLHLPQITDSALALGDLATAAAGGANAILTAAMLAPPTAIGVYVDAQLEPLLAEAVAAHPEAAQRLRYDGVQQGLSKLLEITANPGDESWKPDAAAVLVARQQIVAQAGGLQASLLVAVDVAVRARTESVTTQRAMIMTLLGLSMLLVGYMFISFSRVMQGGLAEVRRHLRAMTDGDLTTVPRPWGKDEAASLMHTLREMQEALRGIVTQVRQSSEGIAGSSQQIASGAAELSTRSENTADSLQRAATAMEQIGITVQQTADRAQEATSLGRDNVQAAERGGQVIEQVIVTMQDIRAASSRIGEIIGTVDGLAFQTNILALNAAVEAARAGEAGRGFAVVAAEVRMLAQRSAQSASEIKALVGASVEKVSAGTGIVQRAGQVIGEIVQSSTRVNTLLEGIALSAREQAQGVSDVGRAVSEVDKVTQHNAALVRDTTAAASDLEGQAQVLGERVARFNMPA